MANSMTKKRKIEIEQTLLVLGFTGSLGSGCTYIAKALAQSSNYIYYKLSDIIREVVKSNGNDPSNVQLLQDKGNELRGKKVGLF